MGINITLEELAIGSFEFAKDCVGSKRWPCDQLSYSNGAGTAEMDHHILRNLEPSMYWNIMRVRANQEMTSPRDQSFVQGYNDKAHTFGLQSFNYFGGLISLLTCIVLHMLYSRQKI